MGCLLNLQARLGLYTGDWYSFQNHDQIDLYIYSDEYIKTSLNIV